MSKLIECCLRNTDRSVRREIDTDEELRLLAKPCLQRCGDCERGPLLVIDGELRTGESHRAVLEEIGE